MSCLISITICGGHHNVLRRPSTTGMAVDQQPCSRAITLVPRTVAPSQWQDGRDVKAGPFLEDLECLWSQTGSNTSQWLCQTFLRLLGSPGHFCLIPVSSLPHSRTDLHWDLRLSQPFPFSLTGVSPNKILVCSSPFYCLPLKGLGWTFHFRSILYVTGITATSSVSLESIEGCLQLRWKLLMSAYSFLMQALPLCSGNLGEDWTCRSLNGSQVWLSSNEGVNVMDKCSSFLTSPWDRSKLCLTKAHRRSHTVHAVHCQLTHSFLAIFPSLFPLLYDGFLGSPSR